MLNHVMLGSNDLNRAKAFYDPLLATIGAPGGTFDQKGRLRYVHKGGLLMLTKPIDGQPATIANGFTLGFATDSPEQLQTWHQAGVAHGGTAVEDPPGARDGGIHLAYLRDPDGNKLCAVYRPK